MAKNKNMALKHRKARMMAAEEVRESDKIAVCTSFYARPNYPGINDYMSRYRNYKKLVQKAQACNG